MVLQWTIVQKSSGVHCATRNVQPKKAINLMKFNNISQNSNWLTHVKIDVKVLMKINRRNLQSQVEFITEKLCCSKIYQSCNSVVPFKFRQTVASASEKEKANKKLTNKTLKNERETDKYSFDALSRFDWFARRLRHCTSF